MRDSNPCGNDNGDGTFRVDLTIPVDGTIQKMMVENVSAQNNGEAVEVLNLAINGEPVHFQDPSTC